MTWRNPARRAISLSLVPQSKSKRSRYTPPPPKNAPASPLWMGVAITTFLLTGLVVVVTNYLGLLPGDAENRYLIVEVEDDFPLTVPEDYRWVTVNQLMGLLRLSNYLNVEARSLVACLNTLW